ncbi:MAG: flagellar M-ring protein FliF [Planctomycetota bacterium]|nr:MAG: flagellar M-ring protein FliF [Planctomycetota bacterium]
MSLRASWEQIAKIWADLPAGRRLLASVAAAGFLLVGVILLVASRSIDYAPLYHGLGQADAARVLDRLRSKQVPYRLEDGGRTVLVPWARVAELRLELAADGAVQGDDQGLELFDRGGFVQTQFAEQVTYTRALQGELARTISALEPVERAVVHIGRPRRSVFVRQQEKPTASVVLRLRPGRSLSARQLGGIRQLVAASVPGLEADRVSVLDASGAALAGPGLDGESPPAPGFARARDAEDYLVRKAQSLLDAAFGPGRAVVRVTARLDTQRVEERRETLETVPVSEKTTQRRTTRGQGAAPSPATARASSAGPGQEEVEETEETAYEVGRSTSLMVKEPGSIQRLTVGLLIDERLAEQAPKLERIVKEAVGFDPKRGDTYQQATVPFEPGLLESAREELDAPPPAAGWTRLLPELTLAAAVLLAGVLGFLALRRGSAPPTPAANAPATDAPSSLPATDPATQREQLRAAAAQGVAQSPAVAGQLLEAWLGETGDAA